MTADKNTMKQTINTEYLGVEQVAAMLGLRLSRIRHMVFKKQIPYIKLGASIRFDKEQLKNWINTKAIKAGG